MHSVEDKIRLTEEALKLTPMPEEDRNKLVENSRVFFEYEAFMMEKLGKTDKEVQDVFGEYMAKKLSEDMTRLDSMTDEERKEIMGTKTQQDYMRDFSLTCMEEYAKENEFPKWEQLAEAFTAISSISN